jgi:hypothetical protein
MSHIISDDVHMRFTLDNDMSRSQRIVKITPRVHVKKTPQMRIPKRATRIYVKPTPRYDVVKKETRQNPLSSSPNSGNASSSSNDDISLDAKSLNDASVSEIIALLEQARSRSRNLVENEVKSTLTSKPNISQWPPRRQTSYY